MSPLTIWGYIFCLSSKFIWVNVFFNTTKHQSVKFWSFGLGVAAAPQPPPHCSLQSWASCKPDGKNKVLHPHAYPVYGWGISRLSKSFFFHRSDQTVANTGSFSVLMQQQQPPCKAKNFAKNATHWALLFLVSAPRCSDAKVLHNPVAFRNTGFSVCAAYVDVIFSLSRFRLMKNIII